MGLYKEIKLMERFLEEQDCTLPEVFKEKMMELGYRLTSSDMRHGLQTYRHRNTECVILWLCSKYGFRPVLHSLYYT